MRTSVSGFGREFIKMRPVSITPAITPIFPFDKLFFQAKYPARIGKITKPIFLG